MNPSKVVSAAREGAKLSLRRSLLRLNLGVSSDPFVARVSRAITSREVHTALDVGANEGQYAALLRASGFAGNIESFEPLQDAFERLRRRSRRDGSWTPHQMAIGRAPGELPLHVAGNSYSSSFLEMAPLHHRAAPGSEFIDTVVVKVQPLTWVFESMGIDPTKTFLKIDTQGFEAEVLAGLGTELLGRLAAVQLEVSFHELYLGQMLYDEVSEQMEASGFQLGGIEPGICDEDGRILQADILFLRG